MKKYPRKYLAHADNGRDYIHFVFESFHKANSRKNKLDAEWDYLMKHGKDVNVIKTSRVPDDYDGI